MFCQGYRVKDHAHRISQIQAAKPPFSGVAAKDRYALRTRSSPMAELNLRRRLIEDINARNLSPVTQRCYVHAVAKFAQYFNRLPDRLGLADVRTYQIHLVSSGMSWAGINVAVCAPRFLYGVTLGLSTMVDRIPYARKRRQLLVILSADEVVQFLAAVPNLKHRTALMAAYTGGLWVSEVVRLTIADIDSSRMLTRSPSIPCGTASPHICSKRAPISARSKWEKVAGAGRSAVRRRGSSSSGQVPTRGARIRPEPRCTLHRGVMGEAATPRPTTLN
jgi:hypothetical protein